MHLVGVARTIVGVVACDGIWRYLWSHVNDYLQNSINRMHFNCGILFLLETLLHYVMEATEVWLY